MPFATRGNLVWLGMILSGVALGVYVLAAWPDTSPQVVRLPYGEAMPKTPRTVAAAQRREIVTATPNGEPTAAAPAPVPQRAPASPPPALEAAAPEESAYELGAEPLPETGQATPKSVQQQPAGAAPASSAPAPAAEPEPAPEPAPEEPPLLEIIIGSVPPSGSE